MSEQFELPLQSRLRLLSVDEIFNLIDGNWLKSIQEDDRVERKPVGIHCRTLSRWFSMWANTAPHGGIIAIGISDDGNIDGTLSSEAAAVNDLERTGEVYCQQAQYECKRVNVTNKTGKPDQILLIRVPYNSRKVVRTSDGSAYIRRGSSCISLNEDEVRELQIAKGEVAWEREPSTQKYPEDFDEKAIQQFAQAVIEKLELQHSQNVEDVLEHRHLGRLENGNFVPNKACALLFSKDPCREIRGCRIRFLKYEGNDEKLGAEYNVIKDQWIEGNIPSQLVQAERLIESQMREFSRLGKDGKFSTSPEYPKAAWYEGVVNAVCHRSYNLENIPIFIKMFDGRLEFQSPGGFLPFVTPANIYDISHPRNPDLMLALHYLEYVKCANEGTRRMRKTMTDLDLPAPIFSEKQTSHIHFQATLKNNVEHRKAWIDSDAAKVVGEMVFQSLTERERRIINYAAENKKISVTDAVRITEAAWETCKSTLLGLCNKGILLHVHRKDIVRDPDAHFILNTNAQNAVSGTIGFRPATRKNSN